MIFIFDFLQNYTVYCTILPLYECQVMHILEYFGQLWNDITCQQELRNKWLNILLPIQRLFELVVWSINQPTTTEKRDQPIMYLFFFIYRVP